MNTRLRTIATRPYFSSIHFIHYHDTDEEFDSGRVHHVLRPGATALGRVVTDILDPPDMMEEDDAPDLSQYRVKLLFIDKNGLEWRRFDYEHPIRGFQDPEPTRTQRLCRAVAKRFQPIARRLRGYKSKTMSWRWRRTAKTRNGPLSSTSSRLSD